MGDLAPAALELPAALRARGFSVRPEADGDLDFLMRLYATTREAELASVPWTPAQKAAFVTQQFTAQRTHYRGYGASCAFLVIEQNGAPVGRIYLNSAPTRLHLVDITLSPACRGKGVGGELLRAVQRQTGPRILGAFVDKANRARRLYQRLGFVEIADHGVYLEIEWTPQRPGALAERQT